MSLVDVERFAEASPAASKLLADGTPAGLQAAVEIAAPCGYGFTVDEVRAFIGRKAADPGRKLSDAELDKVTGGLHLDGWS